MRIVFHILIMMCAVFILGCGESDFYVQKTKSLDSLSGSLNAMVKELEKTDTIILQRAIARFSYYRQFISENLHDTITKDQANQLKRFYEAGQNIEAYDKNRNLILTRAGLVNSQLTKLKEDIKEKIDSELISKFFVDEKTELVYLTEIGYAQQEQLHVNFEKFQTSLHGVEELIKSRNKGVLPTIIKDSIAL